MSCRDASFPVVPVLAFRHELVETFIAVIDAVLHSGLEHAIPVSQRLEDRLTRKLCPLSGQCFKLGRSENDMPCFRKAFKLKRANDSLVG